MFLSSPLDRSIMAFHFTPGRPVHSGTNLTSLGSILARSNNLRAKTIHSHFHHCDSRPNHLYNFSGLGCRGEKENGQTLKW